VKCFYSGRINSHPFTKVISHFSLKKQAKFQDLSTRKPNKGKNFKREKKEREVGRILERKGEKDFF